MCITSMQEKENLKEKPDTSIQRSIIGAFPSYFGGGLRPVVVLIWTEMLMIDRDDSETSGSDYSDTTTRNERSRKPVDRIQMDRPDQKFFRA